jgi:hypothetical protein
LIEAIEISFAQGAVSRRGKFELCGNTKSELGATATSRSLNFPEGESPFWAFPELTLWLVATAPSSDFVLPKHSGL